MTMKKKILTTLSVVLILGLAALGILAYLSDTDSDVNVMALGKVDITQHEYERVDDGNKQHELTDFSSKWNSQEKKQLFPAVYPGNSTSDSIPWAPEDEWVKSGEQAWKVVQDNDNVVDKFVTVENTGKSAAYVRTLIAYEGDATYGPEGPWIHIVHNASNVNPAIDVSEPVFITIEDVEYTVYAYTYREALASGTESIPSLKQVYMDHTADNDVVAKYGDTYDILVLSQAIQKEGFGDATTALNTGYAEVIQKNEDIITGWFTGVLDETAADIWDGTTDTTWYNDTDTEFIIKTAEQLAGLADLVDDGNTFAGKTIKLAKDLDLYLEDENGNRVSFEPIGDASNADFSGTFDGNGKTIYNLYQDCNSKHVALFGAVYEGTVKNLTLDGARVENDGSGYAGAIAAYAGASSFENITLKDSTVVNYNHNTAGIVAWCSNNGTTTTFDGINIEDTTTIGSWWGSYDTRVGGIVGAMNTDNNVVIKNSTVACRLDVYNDACSNYQWYNYRTAGMVVADVRDNHTVDGRTQANPTRVTCENVTVIFGDWANYHYCESASYGTPSYAGEGEYKFNRVEAGLGYGGVDLSACNHAADETHNELIAFDFLFGARDGKGIYGISEFSGVTVVNK